MDNSGTKNINEKPVLSRDHVGSLAKGLSVVEILAGAPSGMRLTEVADAAGLTRAGARRLLLTCVEEGWVHQDARYFTLSTKLLTLTRTWLGSASLWAYAEPIIREVSKDLGESCSVALLQNEDVVYVARVAGTGILSVILSVGTRLPAYCTAMGRILLSGLGEAEFNRYLKNVDLIAKTPKTITNASLLAECIANVRRDGFVIVDEELELGLRSIAIPIRSRSGAIVAAINVSTQTARHSCMDMHDEFLPRLRLAVARIEDYLAFN